MTTFRIGVTLRHLDTFRTITTAVTVGVDGDDPIDATLAAMQLAAAHRDGFSPIDCKILSADV